MARFVDWDLAASTAAALGKSGPHVSYSEAAEAVTHLRRLTDEAMRHVVEYTGLRPPATYAPVKIVDRRDWAFHNIEGLRQVVTPLAERFVGVKPPHPAVAAVGSRVTGAQAGTILAYLSGKVLGQYEVFAEDPGQLLLVVPNIVEVERKLNAEPRDFRLWVCIHEVTHMVQFTSVPWMRGYFLGEVGAFADASTIDGGQVWERLHRAVETIADVITNPDSRASILDLIQNDAQRAVLNRLTALMTLLEGHAEYVMDGVGPTVIPSVEVIRARFNQRRENSNPFEHVVRKLLGIDVKLRQYSEGRAFVHEVVDRIGMENFNKIWQSPLTLPRLGEFADPESWIMRVHGSTNIHDIDLVSGD